MDYTVSSRSGKAIRLGDRGQDGSRVSYRQEGSIHGSFFYKKVMGKRVIHVIAGVIFIVIAFTILIMMKDVIFLIITGITTLAEVILGMQTAIRGW